MGATALIPATNYQLFGAAAIVTPGHSSNQAAAIQSVCSSSTPYGGVSVAVPSGLTVGGLNTLAGDYMFAQGTDAGGSPRFSVDVTTPNGPASIFLYFGPPPNYTGDPSGVWLNTGNLASPGNLVDASQLGGNFYETYSDVQAAYGSYPVTGVSVVVDGCWAQGSQSVEVDNLTVNNTTVTFEKPVAQSKDQCKGNGWKDVTRADGSGFKNQGECIKYVNTGI